MECFKKRYFLLLILLLELGYLNCKRIEVNPRVITSGPDGQLTAEVLINGNEVTVKWKSLMNNFAKIYMNMVSLNHDKSSSTAVLDASIDTFSFYDLIEDRIYRLEICKLSLDNHTVMECARGRIQIKPNQKFFLTRFHGETSLCIEWQQISLEDVAHYEVSITPSNQTKWVDKSHSNVTFDGLIPGKEYTISVQTASYLKESYPNIIKLRTLPLIPSKVRIDPKSLSTKTFVLLWDRPSVECEFDHYNIYLNDNPKNIFLDDHSKKIVIDKKGKSYMFLDLVPGKKYQPFIQSVSGEFTSEAIAPDSGPITTKPLPIHHLLAMEIEDGKKLNITWIPNVGSIQNEYSVTIIDKRNHGEIAIKETTNKTYLISSTFVRNDYEVTVYAISDGVFSEETTIEYRET